MGRYLRKKSKVKKVKRITSDSMILDFINNNLSELNLLTTIDIKKEEIDYGDEWDNTSGYEYIINFIEENNIYTVGKVKIIEDRENYGQAESWIETHCIDHLENNIDSTIVLEKLEQIIE